MCSIFAILGPGFDSKKIDIYQNASLKMRHRGPDYSAFASNSDYYLGHNRLSISGGEDNNQPRSSLNKTCHLIFNGQIYNCPELISRYSLEVDPENDSQVLVELLERFGVQILSEINGVFAGVFIDEKNRTAVLFRDKVGARPLYFFQKENSVIVSSEIAPILEFNEEKSVDISSIAEIFALNFTVSKDTFYKGVRAVPPATSLCLNLESGQIVSSEEYFQYGRQLSTRSASKELKSAFIASLKRQNPKNLDTVIYLSSGLDSSLMTILSAELGFNFCTATVRFSGIDTCESLEASSLASALKVNWRAIEIDKEKFSSNLPDALIALQEPRIGQSCINYILHKEIAPDFKIAFSGAGADELFGGYPWRYPLRVENEQVLPISKNLNETASWIASKWCKIGDFESAINCFDIKIDFSKQDGIQIVKDELSKYDIDWNDEWAAVEACLAFERKHFLKNLLTVDDSLAMRFGLEVRVPFLDDEIVQLSQCFHPSEFFTYSRKTGSILGKAPIRELVRQLGFPEVSSRQKLGFSAPTELIEDSIIAFIFDSENTPIQSINREKLLDVIGNLEERERQSFLWTMAEIISLA